MARTITTVHIAPDFEKAYFRLPKHIQILATRKDQWFHSDAFLIRASDPQTKRRSLGLLGLFNQPRVSRAISVSRPSEVLYYDVGTHEIYR
jgi:hypothetical protein